MIYNSVARLRGVHGYYAVWWDCVLGTVVPPRDGWFIVPLRVYVGYMDIMPRDDIVCWAPLLRRAMDDL